MSLTRTDKENLSKEYASIIDESSGFLLFDYRGLTVEQITELRNNVREVGGTMRVVKNRMLKIAVKDKPYTEVQDILTGPNAVIFVGEDPVSPAKALVDFAKGHEKVEVKGGVVNNLFMEAAQIGQLAKIPPRDQLFANILGGIKAPASNILGCVKALSNKQHGLIKALVEKLEAAA